MAISARNKLQGRVSHIKSGEVMCLVTLDAQGTKVIAAVTNQGVEELNLKQNDQVTAIIKSTEVMLVKGEGQTVFSARNRFAGQVQSVQKGEAMGLVTVKTGQFHLGAAITREAIDEMSLKQGDQLTAVVKATEVMLMK
ncbi:MAG: TOBE domain-containing protein [Nitrospiraceae bacterium]